MIFDLVSAGYQGRSPNIDAQNMVNFYPEIEQIDGKKVVKALVGTPGLSIFSSVGIYPVRGMHVFNGFLYVISNDGLYSINSAGILSAKLGTLLTTSGRVSMENNGVAPTGGNQLMIVDNPYGYIYNVQTTVFSQITMASSGGGWPALGAAYCTMMDGYFIIAVGGFSAQFQVSSLYDGTTWAALDAAGDSYDGDKLVAIRKNHSELWLFGDEATEFWYDSGQGRPPFQRIQGGVLDHGLAAALSLAEAENTLFWLAQSMGGSGYVVVAEGHSVKRISTAPIEYQWQQYSTITDAFAYTYMDEGHNFYVLTFPAGNATWVYDITTGFWHQRSTYISGSQYAINRHIGNNHVFWNGKQLIGDYSSGRIFQMSSANYTDSGNPIVSIRTAPTITTEQKNMFFHKLQIDMETGAGNSLGGGGGANPNLILDWSDDNGRSWSNQHSAAIGASGQYSTRVIFRRLGKSRSRTFRIMISDAIKKVITDSHLEASAGEN